ncbi:MAG: hypothetical protein ABW136_04475 [Steroidobacteraceae bacterium]
MRSRLAPVLVASLLAACGRPSTGVAFEYSPTLDRLCSMVRGARIDPAWSAELQSRLGEFRSQWQRVGPELLSNSETLTGLSFPKSNTVRLTLCDLPSQSIVGTSVNLRFALASFAAHPVSLRYKIDTVHHELLHSLLSGHVPDSSPLLVAHADEPACVRNHLHLLALQKAVLIRMGASGALADVEANDASLPNGCYRRTWALVNDGESRYLDYVAEIARR